MNARLIHAIALAMAVVLSAKAEAGSGKPSGQENLENGRLLAQRECSSCHAIGATGRSPRADAPPFRHILARYHPAILEQELVEGIKLGHPDMPRFRLNPKSVDALIAYLRKIQSPRVTAAGRGKP